MSHYLLSLQINGRDHQMMIESTELLVDVLRERCGLTGTHVGCDTAQCGACTVVVEGVAIKSCNVLALQVNGTSVQTIESDPIVLQRCFSEHHALQCGFCTPGMIMRCVAMVNETVALNSVEVADALEGNLCRCTGYLPIVSAAIEGVEQLRKMQASL